MDGLFSNIESQRDIFLNWDKKDSESFFDLIRTNDRARSSDKRLVKIQTTAIASNINEMIVVATGEI